jgi:hypothetical protein
MILLELTEKEAEIVKQALNKEKAHWENSSPKEISRSLIDNNLSICENVFKKINFAFEPQLDVLITSNQLFGIISSAKDEYHKLVPNLHISNKIVDQNDLKHISLANAFILWLNGNKLLKRLVKFDYTDNSCQYEENE